MPRSASGPHWWRMKPWSVTEATAMWTTLQLPASSDKHHWMRFGKGLAMWALSADLIIFFLTKKTGMDILAALAYQCYDSMAVASEHEVLIFVQIWPRICLDILRALRKEPDTASAILAELQQASELLAGDVGKGYLASMENIQAALSNPLDTNFGREVADQLAVCFQASCLLQFGDPLVAEAFLAARWSRLPVTQTFGSATSALPDSGSEGCFSAEWETATDDTWSTVIDWRFSLFMFVCCLF